MRCPLTSAQPSSLLPSKADETAADTPPRYRHPQKYMARSPITRERPGCDRILTRSPPGGGGSPPAAPRTRQPPLQKGGGEPEGGQCETSPGSAAAWSLGVAGLVVVP
mmetsp:Transcript_8979/g.20939  ORF Transcript_8979/g.20939 Transcript_8979/m.20939 type:complete len:108 (-) Transcript_8979:183-506(-)